MGMEGKLRQVSEFELATYRRTPAKLYSDLLARYQSEGFTRFASVMQEFENSPLVQRVRQRASAGQPPVQEDLDALHQHQSALMKENRDAFDEVQCHMIGLNKDGSQLSLYKDWHILHYLLTGESWEPADTPLGRAIVEGAEIPDVEQIVGYGPAKYVTPSEVREIAEALTGFPIEERVNSFDLGTAQAAKVYPVSHWRGELSNESKKGLIRYFELLRDFYRDAAEKGNGVIHWLV